MSAPAQIDWSKYGGTQQFSAPSIDFSEYDGSATPRTWKDSVGDFASHLWNQINPVAGFKGAAQLAAHPIETYKADTGERQKVYDEAEKAFKSGDYAAGAAKLLYSFAPFIGPQLNQAANDFANGKTASALGTSTGIGLAAAGPEAVKNVAATLPGAGGASELADRAYQSALKPPPGSYSQPEVNAMVKTGLENEIPISKAGRAKLADLVTDLNDKVSAQIKAGAQAGQTVNKYDVASRLSGTAKRFATQVTPESDLNAVSESGNEFLRNQPNDIGVQNAQDLKVGTYTQLKSRAFGELKSATIESQKALARGIKEELQDQFPEIKGLNAKEGQILNLDEALERAVNRTSNHNLFSLGGKMAAGAGAVIGGAGGGPEGAGVGAAAATAMHYVLSDPMVQSKLAIALHQASKGSVTIPAAAARVASYTNTLGNAANSSSSDQGAQQ